MMWPRLVSVRSGVQASRANSRENLDVRAGVSKSIVMLRRMKRPRRVVITGMGCVTPLGIGREAFWGALARGESGVRRIESFDVSDSPVKIAAEVRDFHWEAQLNPKDRRHVPRTVPLALAAARESLDERDLFHRLALEDFAPAASCSARAGRSLFTEA